MCYRILEQKIGIRILWDVTLIGNSGLKDHCVFIFKMMKPKKDLWIFPGWLDPLKMKALWSFKICEITNPVTWHLIPEDTNPQQPYCENLKSCTVQDIVIYVYIVVMGQ